MTTEVKIPAMGESITSGILATWHVKDGDIVEAGQTIFELETDKVSSEGTAEVGGKISLKANEGDEVEIGQVVAVIDESAAGSTSPAKPETKVEPTTPAEGKKAEDTMGPAAKRMAAEEGIDPNTVKGTGKDNRVTKGDLMGTSSTPASTSPSPKEQTKTTPAPEGRTTRKKMTPLRKKIAERLVAAQQEAAMLTTFNEVDMSPIMALRKKFQDSFVEKHGIKLGFMSFFVKAVVNALQEIPEINAQIDGEYIIQNHYFDIGIAVGTPKGLIVPVVRDCETLAFHEIEQAIAGYAKKARDGKIAIEDLQGGVFTISNGGIYGSLLSTPILNAPQSAILGMHAIKERAVVVNKEIVIRPMMNLALSYDHRLVDGKEAVTFLIKVKEALEDPTRLLFGI